MSINTYSYATREDLDKVSDRLSDTLLLFSKELSFCNANQKHILNNLEKLTYELQEYIRENRKDFLKLKDEMKNIPLIDSEIKSTKKELDILKEKVDSIIDEKNVNKKIRNSLPIIFKILSFVVVFIYIVVDFIINFMPQINTIIHDVHGKIL